VAMVLRWWCNGGSVARFESHMRHTAASTDRGRGVCSAPAPAQSLVITLPASLQLSSRSPPSSADCGSCNHQSICSQACCSPSVLISSSSCSLHTHHHCTMALAAHRGVHAAGVSTHARSRGLRLRVHAQAATAVKTPAKFIPPWRDCYEVLRNKGLRTVAPEEAKDLLASGDWVLIDVRCAVCVCARALPRRHVRHVRHRSAGTLCVVHEVRQCVVSHVCSTLRPPCEAVARAHASDHGRRSADAQRQHMCMHTGMLPTAVPGAARARTRCPAHHCPRARCPAQAPRPV
jgi:hypothetical protein